MENGMKLAVDQMKQREEAGLNYIYSQTYNFVYLRAKSILKQMCIRDRNRTRRQMCVCSSVG